jgi:hypothetical protein
MASRRSLAGAVFQGGTRLVSRAAHAVLNDPRGQEALARAVGMAQRGRRRLEGVQERVMAAAGIPGRQDVQDIARQLARIRRKARDLSARIGAATLAAVPSAGAAARDRDGETR